MILKGNGGDFQGIGLIRVLWQTVTGVLNHHFTSEIKVHDVLHGFQIDRGMSTSALNSKLLQQLTSTREAVLYEIFLDLQKVYNDLLQDRCLKNLAAYKLGPRSLQLLRTYWVWITMVARAMGYYDPPLKDIVV